MRLRILQSVLLGLSLQLLPGPAAAQKQASPELLRELGGISEYRLANGLQVLLFPDASQTTTTVNITYRVGSRHEAQGEFGMAHLLEHLVFKGTPKTPDIGKAFEDRSMRFNGSTTVDRTNYFASFNAKDETLAFAIELEADRMLNARILRSDLDKEMTVVRNEYERGETEPMRVLRQRVASVAYDWHNYGHSTIGTKSDIEGVPIDKLQAFYTRYYRPDNATLLIAGRFEPKFALARIAAAFGPLAKPSEPVADPYTVEPAQDGERSVVVRRVGGRPAVMAHYHVPAMSHPDTPALIVYGLLMSAPPTGPIYKELVETRLAVAAQLGGSGERDPGGALAIAILPEGTDLAAVEKKLTDMVEGGREFKDSDLDFVRNVALRSYRESMKRPEALIGQISHQLGAGDWRLMFQLMEDIPKVSLADVQRVREAYFKPANRTIGRYLPAEKVERVQIPPAPPLAERLARLQGPPKVEDGEVFEPTPANLQARTRVVKLPSGIELALLNKQTRGNAVTLTLQLRWGEARETTKALGTQMIDDLLFEGTARWNKQQIRDEFLRLKAEVSINGGNQFVMLNIRGEKDGLIGALKLAAELMKEPLLPQDAFERIKAQQIAGIEASRQQLDTLRLQAVRGHYNSARGVKIDDPGYIASVDENLDEVRRTTLADVRGFHQRYWSADAARVAVVGALPQGLEAAIEESFGSWKKADAPRFVRYISPQVNIPVARFDVQAADKANASVHMAQRFALGQTEADYLPMQIAARIFGGGADSRLYSRVRQREGLSYSVGAGLQAPYWGRDAGLTITASVAPAQRERVIQAVQDELRKMAEEGVSEEEVARTRKDLAETQRRAFSTEPALAFSLNFQAEIGRDWAYEAEQQAKLQAVTREQVNAAWRRLIKPDGFVISTAGDFTKQ